MPTSPRGPRVRSLVLAWLAYWVALVAVVFGPALLVLLRLTRADAHGDAKVTFGNDGLAITISEAGRAAWALAASLGELAFWIAVPPLALLVVWTMVGHARARDAREAGEAGETPLDAPDAGPRLGAPPQDFASGTARERVHERRREPR